MRQRKNYCECSRLKNDLVLVTHSCLEVEVTDDTQQIEVTDYHFGYLFLHGPMIILVQETRIDVSERTVAGMIFFVVFSLFAQLCNHICVSSVAHRPSCRIQNACWL
jgi:hypothetical protein